MAIHLSGDRPRLDINLEAGFDGVESDFAAESFSLFEQSFHILFIPFASIGV